MAIVLMLFFGAALIAGPIAANVMDKGLGTTINLIMIGSGAGLVLLSLLAIIITKLYIKTKASEAFVKTGAGGKKVILDGGTIFIPFVHELVRVSLRSLKLEIISEKEKAMITNDKLRADIKAEFFVRVKPDAENIIQAATTLGDKMGDPSAVMSLIEDKLTSALRTAAAKNDLEDLNSNREKFIEEVEGILKKDLSENGFILESVTISKLDQTDEEYLKDGNIFDAQGSKKIAEITQVNLTERNRLVREGEQARKNQDVQTQKQILAFEQDEAEATARQDAEVKKIQAETKKDAAQKSITAQREVELAEVQKAEALAVAKEKKDQQVAVAQEQREKAIAAAAKEKAAEEALLAKAQADREKEAQQIETVKITEAANRERQKTIIAAEAEAQSRLVAEQRAADAAAYKIEKDADARKKAADADAEAVTKKAQADANAKKLEAEGIEAVEMVPVKVDREKVKIDQDRVENVIKPELEARQQSGKVAQDFEIQKLAVAAEKEVRIETARASVALFSKMEASLYGTPQDAINILGSVLKGQSGASLIEGFLASAGPETKGALDKIGQVSSSAADALSRRLADGKQPPAVPAPAGIPQKPKNQPPA